jgi:hypothetical protein
MTPRVAGSAAASLETSTTSSASPVSSENASGA